MIIGALIGLFISTLWTMISYMNLIAAFKELKAIGYKPVLTYHWQVTIVKTIMMTSLGAIIGYFVS